MWVLPSVPAGELPRPPDLYTRAFPAWGGSMQWPSTRLMLCPSFSAKSQADRGQLITQLKACKQCSSWMHESVRCPLRIPRCRAREGSVECGCPHLQELHSCPSIAMKVVLKDGQGTHTAKQEEGPGTNTVSTCFTQHQALLGLQLVEIQTRRGTARAPPG